MNAATNSTRTLNLYGHVCDYQTGETIRPATREDWLTGQRLGERHTGAHRTDEFGDRTIYVDGPESDPEAPVRVEIAPSLGHPARYGTPVQPAEPAPLPEGHIDLWRFHERYSGHSDQASAWDLICTASSEGWTFYLGGTAVDTDDAIVVAGGDPRVLEWDLPAGPLSLKPPPALAIKVAADLMRSSARTDADMHAAAQFERVGRRIFGD